MDLADLHDGVGLCSDRTRVAFVHIWGGFLNPSFRVTDGEADLHRKVTDDGEIRAGLRGWARVRGSASR